MSTDERIDRLEKLVYAFIETQTSSDEYKKYDIEGCRKTEENNADNIESNSIDISDNSNGVFDIADTISELSDALFDLAEYVAELEAIITESEE